MTISKVRRMTQNEFEKYFEKMDTPAKRSCFLLGILAGNTYHNAASKNKSLEFFDKLNGGVLLLPDVKMHPARRADDLYIMGEYSRRQDMGRYITIYFGSFERVYGHLQAADFREQLKRVLVHEFTHHVENLAGERGLEIKDAQNMEKYNRRHGESN